MKQHFDFDVFLSHNSRDKPRVRQIAESLKAAGLRVWFDEWIIAHGDDIFLAIERGLQRSRTQLLFLSNAALGSEWVDLERSSVLFRDPTNKDRRFVPVLLEDCTLPVTLKRYKYVDFRTDSHETRAALIAACRGEVSPSEVEPPAPPKQPRPPARPRKPKPEARIFPFALLSAGSFVAGFLVLWVILEKAELLTRLGLTGRLFYVLLVLLGLSAAAFLFGALQSYAVYRGEVLGGMLKLGGPVVVFGLVVLGGFGLPTPPEPFSLMVFVHGKDGVHDLPLRGKGIVVLDLGQDRRRESIGEKGQAFFAEIAPTFRGRSVSIGLEAEGFQIAEGNRTARLDSEVIYLPAERMAFEVSGKVLGAEGLPIAGAKIRLRELISHSDGDGAFNLVVPGEWAEQALLLQVTATGFPPWQTEVFPRSHEVDVILRKNRP